jgi:hypothetical protein
VLDFKEVVLERENKRIIWEYIGEGYDGEYNPNDVNDSPLLRFVCSELNEKDNQWYEMDNASYCTRLLVNTPYRILIFAGVVILNALNKPPYQKKLEELSWLCLKDF